MAGGLAAHSLLGVVLPSPGLFEKRLCGTRVKLTYGRFKSTEWCAAGPAEGGIKKFIPPAAGHWI